MGELEIKIGDTISFWVHASDENYTGIVQEILTLNGSLTMLILCENDYRIFSLANVYGITVIQPMQQIEEQQTTQELIQQPVLEEHAESDQDEDVFIEDTSDLVRRAISVIKSLIPPHHEPIIMNDYRDESDESECKEEVMCPICLESVDMNQNAMSTECGHKFHFTCIMKNMAANSGAQNSCPLCRESVIKGFTVCDDDESVNRLFQRLTQERSILIDQIEQRQLIRNMLSQELTRTEQVQRRLLDAREVLHQTAFQIITQHAQHAHLNEGITNLIASAANNNLKENYDELYEFYHDEIRNMCFNLGMRILCSPCEETVQESPNPVQPHQQPIVID
jgi:Ring finger domain